MKHRIMKIGYLFYLISMCSLFGQTEESTSLTETFHSFEKFNERGYLNTASGTVHGKEIITDYDGNMMFKYDIPLELPDGLSSDITMVFNSNIEHRVFTETSNLAIPITGQKRLNRGLPVNQGEWLLGFRGIALHAFTYDINIYANRDNNITNYYPYELSGDQTPLLIPGYHYNNLFNRTNQVFDMDSYNRSLLEQDFRDEITILASDGSKIQLFNETSGISSNDRFIGKYSGAGMYTKAYAIVEISPESYELEYLRDVHYYPGDGTVYHFKEHNTTYKDFQVGNGAALEERFHTPRILVLHEITSPNGVTLKIEYDDFNNSIPTSVYGRFAYTPKRILIKDGILPAGDNYLEVAKFEGDYLNQLRISNCLVNSTTEFELDYATNACTDLRETTSRKRAMVVSITDDQNRMTEIDYNLSGENNFPRYYFYSMWFVSTSHYTLCSYNVVNRVIEKVSYPYGKVSLFDYKKLANGIPDYNYNRNAYEELGNSPVRDLQTNTQISSHTVMDGDEVLYQANYSFPEPTDPCFYETQSDIISNITKSELVSVENSVPITKTTYIEKEFVKYLCNHQIGYTSGYSSLIKLKKETTTYENSDEYSIEEYTYNGDENIQEVYDPYTQRYIARVGTFLLEKTTRSVFDGSNSYSTSREYDYDYINIGIPAPSSQHQYFLSPVVLQGSTETDCETGVKTTIDYLTERTLWDHNINNGLNEYRENERYIAELPYNKKIYKGNSVQYELTNTFKRESYSPIETGYLLIGSSTENKVGIKTTKEYDYIEDEYDGTTTGQEYFYYTGLPKSITINNKLNIDYYYPSITYSSTYNPNGSNLTQSYSFDATKLYADGTREIKHINRSDINIMSAYKTITSDLNTGKVYEQFSDYDEIGNLVADVDPNEYLSEYTYDNFRRMKSAAFPGDFSISNQPYSTLITPVIERRVTINETNNGVVGHYVYVSTDKSSGDILPPIDGTLSDEKMSSEPDPTYYYYRNYHVYFDENIDLSKISNLNESDATAHLKIKCGATNILTSGQAKIIEVCALYVDNNSQTGYLGTPNIEITFVDNTIIDFSVIDLLRLVPSGKALKGFRFITRPNINASTNVKTKKMSFDESYVPQLITNLKETNPQGQTNYVTYSFDYSNHNRTVMLTEFMEHMDSSSKSIVTQSEWDALGRLYKFKQFDLQGNPRIKSLSEMNYNGDVTKITDALGRNTFNYYDEQGRLSEKRLIDENSSSSILTNSYDLVVENGEVFARTRSKDAQNVITETYLNNLGNKVKDRFYKEASPSVYTETHYEYDDFNRLTKIISQGGIETTYEYYDEGSRLKSKSSPDHSTIKYKYDSFGNLINTQENNRFDDAQLKEMFENVFNVYDGLNRKTKVGVIELNEEQINNIDNYVAFVNIWQADTANLVVIHQFDEYSGTGVFAGVTAPIPLMINLKGRLAATAFRDKPGQPWSYKYYGYNERGQIKYYYLSYQGGALKGILYEYDKLGNIVKESIGNSYQGIRKYNYYDEFGRLVETKSSKDSDYGLTDFTFSYYDDDKIEEQSFQGGVKTNYTYNSRGLLEQIYTTNTSNLSLPEIYKERIYYLNNNNIEYTWHDNYAFTPINGSNCAFKFYYDHLNQITYASSSEHTCTFRYVGENEPGKLRLIIRPGERYDNTYKAGTNQLQSVRLNQQTSYYFDYDKKGNMTHNGLSDIYINDYNYKNLPLNTESNDSEYYHYDESGNRIYKKNTSKEECYFVDAYGKIQAVYDKNSSYYNTFYLQNGLGKIDVDYGTGTSSKVFNRAYYIKDHLRSVRVTIDEDGDVLSAQDYYPFGKIIPSRSYNVGDPNDKFKFTGKERDKLTKFDYFGARYYDSNIALWMSVDPMADKYPGWSPYNYCANNPIILVDPDGKAPNAVWGFFIGGGVELVGQMTTSMIINGDSFTEAFKNVDWTDVGTSAVIGAASSGLSSWNAIGKTTKLVANATLNIVEGYTQANTGSNTSEYGISEVAVDGALGATAEVFGDSYKKFKQGSREGKSLAHNAKRTQNIAKRATARPSQIKKAKDAKQIYEDFGAGVIEEIVKVYGRETAEKMKKIKLIDY